MAQSDLYLLDDELAAILSDALGNGNVEAGLVKALALCADWSEAHCVGREMACARGCPHCCVLNVAVLLPEAMRITETIKTLWPERHGALCRNRWSSTATGSAGWTTMNG